MQRKSKSEIRIRYAHKPGYHTMVRTACVLRSYEVKVSEYFLFYNKDR
jgi:hypothetical protein